MRTISINVPPNVADAFENADEDFKRKAEIYINSWLSNNLSNQTANERLFTVMKKATAIAKANGFSEAELQVFTKN